MWCWRRERWEGYLKRQIRGRCGRQVGNTSASFSVGVASAFAEVGARRCITLERDLAGRIARGEAEERKKHTWGRHATGQRVRRREQFNNGLGNNAGLVRRAASAAIHARPFDNTVRVEHGRAPTDFAIGTVVGGCYQVADVVRLSQPPSCCMTLPTLPCPSPPASQRGVLRTIAD